MLIIRTVVPTAMLVALFAAGCANNTGAGGASDPVPTVSVSGLPSAGSGDPLAGAPSHPAGEPTSGRPAAGGKTLTGTVTAGVEPNCMLLTGSGGDHLLIFDDPAMRTSAAVGTKVTVVGRAEPGMMSTCQQGTPFIVTEIRPAG